MALEEIQKFLVDVPAKTKPEEILNLPLKHIKGISLNIQKTLENTLDVKTISDFTKKVLTISNINLLKILNITETDLDKWQSIATYVTKLVQGTADLEFDMKILIVGLNNAGKTAILNIITKRFNLCNLKPTKGLNVKNLTCENVKFVLWDMGGQESYRKEYIANPDRYFVGVNSVIYVIDIQNKADYELSKEYLIKILEILESFKEFPDFYIFLHKSDPQIIDQIKDDTKECENIITNVFENRDFEYRIFHTSIYNPTLTETNLADSLSKLLETYEDQGLSTDLTNSLQFLYNNIVSLSFLIEDKFRYFENRLSNIEEQNKLLLNIVSKGKSIELPVQPIPISKEPPPKSVTQLPSAQPPLSPRAALNMELKRLFQKRKIE